MSGSIVRGVLKNAELVATPTHAGLIERSEMNIDKRRVPGEGGLWLLVLGDMSLFALFFIMYMYSRGKNPVSFANEQTYLSLTLGTINTVLLLSSSLAIALGVTSVLSGATERARLFGIGLACGVGFAVVKALEWSHLFAENKWPSTSEFFMYYFMFTGIHLGHVVIGCAVLGSMIVAGKGVRQDNDVRQLCESGGIFWHMVDLLWVALFALFYLVR